MQSSVLLPPELDASCLSASSLQHLVDASPVFGTRSRVGAGVRAGLTDPLGHFWSPVPHQWCLEGSLLLVPSSLPPAQGGR